MSGLKINDFNNDFIAQMIDHLDHFMVNHFVNPTERVYGPFLLLSVLLALWVLWARGEKKPWEALKKGLFSKEIWLHPSSILDLKLFLFNHVIKLIFLSLFASFLLSSHSLSHFFLKILRDYGGDISPLSTNEFVMGLSYTLFAFVFLDFMRFIQHYLMHKIPFLWVFHKVHHSAKVLTPLTLYRVHPGEILVSMARSSLAVVIPSSLYVYLFQAPIHGFDILGVNILGFLFNAFGANLRHSHIWMSFGVFEYVFISPAQHQIHHSNKIEHRDKNLGVCLAIWDILWGTFLKSNLQSNLKSKKRVKLQFGLTPHHPHYYGYLGPGYLSPSRGSRKKD